jgi:hypothetical protein
MARRTRASARSVLNGVVCRSTFTCNQVISDLTFHMIDHSALRNAVLASAPNARVHLQTTCCYQPHITLVLPPTRISQHYLLRHNCSRDGSPPVHATLRARPGSTTQLGWH